MNDDPSTRSPPDDEAAQEPLLTGTMRGWLRRLLSGRNGGASARDTLEELIEEREEVPLDKDEKRLLANVLDLRGCTVHDVMVPGADIVAVEADTSLAEVTRIMTEEGHSRLPVYRQTIDDAMGMIHIKDVLAWRGDDKDFVPARVLRQVLFVAPSMQVLELLLEMRVKRSHMALVVDEFGGVDGLVTIEDLVEEIVGEIEDEHDRTDEPYLVHHDDGTLDADARVPVETLEEIAGAVLTDEEREDVETLGGLVAALAGRVPIRGELIAHASGLEFEVVDADPRRVKRIRVRGLTTEAGAAPLAD
ncbi:MAG: hemolysin family protein [Rhodospirillales bacterium]|jgi:CBS domain containing-hemolysin-like protein|nr:hemolysin family protein [Rhodospirillales bacterium]